MKDQTPSILGGYKEIHSMSSFLAKVDEHFKRYPLYISVVTICDEGEADFGFLLAAPHVRVERDLEDIHYINGKAVQIGRILFVSGLPRGTTSDEFSKFFSKFGEIEECEIASDKLVGARRADFGLIVFKFSRIVDELAKKGRIRCADSEVVVKKAKILILSIREKVSMLRRFEDNLQRGATGAECAFARLCRMLGSWTWADGHQPKYCCEALGATQKFPFPLPESAHQLKEYYPLYDSGLFMRRQIMYRVTTDNTMRMFPWRPNGILPKSNSNEEAESRKRRDGELDGKEDSILPKSNSKEEAESRKRRKDVELDGKEDSILPTSNSNEEVESRKRRKDVEFDGKSRRT